MEEIKKIASMAVNGEISPLKAYIELKKAEKAIEMALIDVKDFAYDEATKYGQKSFKAFGASVELKNGASRWDYKNIPTYNKAKERVQYLEKLAQIGGVDEESGEIIEKAVKIEGKATLSIQLVKD